VWKGSGAEWSEGREIDPAAAFKLHASRAFGLASLLTVNLEPLQPWSLYQMATQPNPNYCCTTRTCPVDHRGLSYPWGGAFLIVAGSVQRTTSLQSVRAGHSMNSAPSGGSDSSEDWQLAGCVHAE
jgi:hypothetical protein